MTNSDIDEFVADAKVARELDITSMTIWRFDNEPGKAMPGWPPLVKIGRRNFRSRRLLEAFKAGLIEESFKRRSASRVAASAQPVA